MGLLTIVGLTLAGTGALAEELEDPTGTACVGAQAEAECGAVAVAPENDASCTKSPCLAASADGNATGYVAVSGTGNATGLWAASLTGDTYALWLAISGTGESRSFYLAASGTGDSDAIGVALSGLGNSQAAGAAISGTGDSESTVVAVSGTGETSALVVAASGMQDAEGCFAASGTGSAQSTCDEDREASGCETGREAGTEEICRDPSERHRLADAAVCDTDLASSDGDAHAWCGVSTTDCAEVVWGVGAGPVFVGGEDSCQAGAFYDEDGHDHALVE